MAKRRVAIIPHTHWDREWYEPFQTFRLRLVDTVDALLDSMRADPSYSRFLLDGQMAVVDDYLAVRPEAEEAIRSLALSGRLSMGPWYILMDEFLVSGETIIRNLQLGLERAAHFGGAMEVGYLPDMFGHIAQMPQVLAQAGMSQAVVWRGVPRAIDRTAFRWSAPDGSAVRAEYLVCSYGNGAAIPEDHEALVRRLQTHEEEIGGYLLDSILFMNGTDHQAPQPWLGRVVDEVNAAQEHFELVVTSLAEELSRSQTDLIPEWHGELRSGARANMLMGVSSNRVDVKQAAARVERELERRAEPLSALFVPAEHWPQAQLDLAWIEVIRNSAHDSVCACSVDDVVDAVLVRYGEGRHIAEGLTKRALSWAAMSMAQAGSYVINPTAQPRQGIVEMLVAQDGDFKHVQVVSEAGPAFGDLELGGAELAVVLGNVRSQEVFNGVFLNALEVTDCDDGIVLDLHLDSVLRTNFLVETVKRDLFARIGNRPDMRVHVRSHQNLRRRVVSQTPTVEGYGWAPMVPSPVRHPVTVHNAGINPDIGSGSDEGQVGGAVIDNGLVRVEVDGSDGTFSVNGLAGFDRLVDSGDHGDTYNYSPPTKDLVVDTPLSVTVEIGEAGPVRARLHIRRGFEWPESIEDTSSARVGRVVTEVTTTIEVRAGSPLVGVTTSFHNRCRDHRLRAVFPLPQPTSRSRAECAFATVERGLVAEGGPSELGLATFPSRRFVQAGGLTVVHEGLLEYELTDIEPAGAGQGEARAHSLSLTLLRATGMLSRVTMAYRPLPAGPPTPMEGPQMQGPVRVRYGLVVGDCDPYAVADEAFNDMCLIHATGGGTRPPSGVALAVSGAQVSSLRRVGPNLELRVFNPGPDQATVDLGERHGWSVDLRGRPIEEFRGGLALRPWGMATLVIHEPDDAESAQRD